MSYKYKRTPRIKQIEALRRLENTPAFALFMAMRTGKTKVIIDDFGRLVDAGQCQDLLVIAPAAVYRTWLTAIEDDLNERIKEHCFIHLLTSNSTVKQNEKLKMMKDHAGPRILLVNVEALSGVERTRQICKEFVKRKCMIAIDESTIIKSIKAKRTKFICQALSPYASYRRILSGLPTPNSPLDIFSQFLFLNPNVLGNNFYTFRTRYAIIKRVNFGYGNIDHVVGFKNLEDLQRRIEPYSYRVRLDECYDLPPKIYQIREVALTREQQQAYQQMKTYATTEIEAGSNVTAQLVITQMLRLHQILCGHVRDDFGRVQTIPQNRIDVLLELLEEYDGKKAIIWGSYDMDIQLISEALIKKYGKPAIAQFWGGNANVREEEEKRFLNDKDCRFMISTTAAGGRGRTWVLADMCVYYSNSHNLEHRSQSEERAQGIDKATSVLYVDLLTPGTIDEKIIQALRNKINIASIINGDNYREWLI